MLLTTEAAAILFTVHWLPLLALVGALYTAAAWRAVQRYGRGALPASWAASTLVLAGFALWYAYRSSTDWGSPHPVRDALLVAGFSAVLLAVCLGAPSALVARRTRGPRAVARVADVAAGAALSAGVWVACNAIMLAAERLQR